MQPIPLFHKADEQSWSAWISWWGYKTAFTCWAWDLIDNLCNCVLSDVIQDIGHKFTVLLLIQMSQHKAHSRGILLSCELLLFCFQLLVVFSEVPWSKKRFCVHPFHQSGWLENTFVFSIIMEHLRTLNTFSGQWYQENLGMKSVTRQTCKIKWLSKWTSTSRSMQQHSIFRSWRRYLVEDGHSATLIKCTANKYFTLRPFIYRKEYERVIHNGKQSNRHRWTNWYYLVTSNF